MNVFQYITFRAIAAALTAFLLSLMCGNWVIRRLISLKVGQPIRTKEEVNKLFELHGEKAGTPTMGGVLLLGAVVVSSLLWARPDNTAVWLLLFTLALLRRARVLGRLSEGQRRRIPPGVSERTKLIAQGILAVDRHRVFPAESGHRSAGARALRPFLQGAGDRQSRARSPSSFSRWSSSARRMR